MTRTSVIKYVQVSVLAALAAASSLACSPASDGGGSGGAGGAGGTGTPPPKLDARTGGSGGSGGGGSGGSTSTGTGGSQSAVDAATMTGSGGASASDGAPDPEPTADAGSSDTTSGGNDAAATADAAPGGGNTLGSRFSLQPALMALWTGARRTVSMDGQTVIFTGAFQANQFGGPNGHTVRLRLTPGKEYLFEYRIRFDGNFPWTRGGKIPGLAGGNAPTGCVTTTGAGFSARMMWRGAGDLVAYTYDNTQSSACGNNLTTGVTFRSNTWYSIKERVKLNTGRTGNGDLQIWVDGQQVLSRTNMNWMNETPTQRIDQVLFHTFFGGSTQDWAPARACSVSYSDVYATLLAQ